MYLFVNEVRENNDYVPPESFLPMLRGRLATFPVPQLKGSSERLDDKSQTFCRPPERLLVSRSWESGRVVLIGDAVLATTPHLAAGACIGIEDAIVLAEELCRMVVENSARLGKVEITN
jgi:2-polyprenyl-6-methoxyphenol hydroxylase-like FAD-dependent oxidoreductase